MKDLHANIKIVNAIAPGTYLSGTNPTSVVVDLAGYNSAVLALSTAVVTDAQTLVVEHSDASGSGFAAVTADDVNGTLADFLAVLASEDSTTAKLGYIGGKRYLKVSSTAAGATGAIYGVTAILSDATNAPVA